MNPRVLAAVGWLVVCSGVGYAQPQIGSLPSPGSLSVPRAATAPPPPASLRVPQPLTRSLPPVPPGGGGGRGGSGFDHPRRGHDDGGFVFGNPNLWYGAYFPYVPKQPRRPQPKPVMVSSHGSLQLNAAPGRAQVYVDAFYVGIVDDFGIRGRRLNLEPGSHRILLRASGYQDLAFDVFIESSRTIVYRGDMEPVRGEPPPPRIASAAPPAAQIPSTPRTIYVIPNCYAGDIPPAGALPEGCNIRDMRARRLN